MVRLPAGTAARRAREAGGVNCDSRGGIARQVGPTGTAAPRAVCLVGEVRRNFGIVRQTRPGSMNHDTPLALPNLWC